MSSSVVTLRLSDSVVTRFYSTFSGAENLSVAINDLLTMLLDEAELNEGMDAPEVIDIIREKIA